MVTDNPFRELPSVTDVSRALWEISSEVSPRTLTTFAQQHLADVRRDVERGAILSREEIVQRATMALRDMSRPRLEPIINATGVIIHTNLGRAPVSHAAAVAMSAAASGFVSLELEPDTNRRGGRMREISTLMRLLTGAESTLVVNNNAAAVLLMLTALASGKSVVVSRGEAVEIGGGFRIPDVMTQSGSSLVEVGTTNRTYARDYEAAITEETAGLLKVHASNFTIEGFTASASIEELAEVCRRRGVPLLEDLGSGALVDTSRFGLMKEPTIGERIASGADLITASGDKLLGGPQAGLIAGRADLVERLSKHPLARAVRADKTCLAGLAATLRHYAAGNELEQIPVLRMISTPISDLTDRAGNLRSTLHGSSDIEITPAQSTIGGGSLPGQTLASVAISLRSTAESVDMLARRLRMGNPRIFGRIEHERLILDLRTVLPEDDVLLAQALSAAINA